MTKMMDGGGGDDDGDEGEVWQVCSLSNECVFKMRVQDACSHVSSKWDSDASKDLPRQEDVKE